MADRGGERTCAKAKALHEAAADVAVTAVTLEHADLQQIVFRIGMPLSVAVRQMGLYTPGQDLARNDADHRRRRACGGHAERSSAVTGERYTVFPPGGCGSTRPAKVSAVTRRPRRKTV